MKQNSQAINGIGNSGTSTVGYLSTGPFDGYDTYTYPSSTITVSSSSIVCNNLNEDKMEKQVKVAIFKVTKDDDGSIVNVEFLKESWIRQKSGTSIELLASKLLDRGTDLEQIRVITLNTLTIPN